MQTKRFLVSFIFIVFYNKINLFQFRPPLAAKPLKMLPDSSKIAVWGLALGSYIPQFRLRANPHLYTQYMCIEIYRIAHSKRHAYSTRLVKKILDTIWHIKHTCAV